MILCLPSSAPEGEPVRYQVETLVLFILGPVVVLALLSLLSVLACRRFHQGRLQRLQEFDTEQGAIDGLITSNVGDSTLAVRVKTIILSTDRVLSLFCYEVGSRVVTLASVSQQRA